MRPIVSNKPTSRSTGAGVMKRSGSDRAFNFSTTSDAFHRLDLLDPMRISATYMYCKETVKERKWGDTNRHAHMTVFRVPVLTKARMSGQRNSPEKSDLDLALVVAQVGD
ncbi:hypothetical protein TWF481_002728 [Arthrobotrys musiformis]|uniref:Uncharacterized protein n=1 Tax=Arthrobotrys musiformis TaxID=47236 RepID=A0AAV9VR14_9PEZI